MSSASIQTLQITYPSTFGVFEDGVQEVGMPSKPIPVLWVNLVCRLVKSYMTMVARFIWTVIFLLSQ